MKQYIQSLQAALYTQGFNPGPIDGLRGPKTERAAADWLKADRGARDKASLRSLQSALASLGHNPGPLDGIRGARTEAAMSAWLKGAAVPAAAPVAPALPDLPWLAEMRTVFGLHEVHDNEKLSAWLRSDRKFLGDPAKLPWCGDAVETAIKNTLPREPFPGALGENPYWAQNWKLFGSHVQPCYGCVLVFVRPTGGHVGFAVGEDDTDFYVLGGNQSNAVNVTRVEKSRLLKGDDGSRWPATYPLTFTKLPRMTPGNIPRTKNEF